MDFKDNKHPFGAASRLRRDERGQSVVELAVVLPLLLLLLLGLLDFGKALNYWITETQVSSEGVRRAAVNVSPATLQQYVKNQIGPAELRDKASICLSFDGTADERKFGHPVKVTVAYHFVWLPFMERFGKVTAITLRNSATMRLERASTASTSNNITPAGSPACT